MGLLSGRVTKPDCDWLGQNLWKYVAVQGLVVPSSALWVPNPSPMSVSRAFDSLVPIRPQAIRWGPHSCGWPDSGWLREGLNRPAERNPSPAFLGRSAYDARINPCSAT